MKTLKISRMMSILLALAISFSFISCNKQEAAKDSKDSAKDGKTAVEKDITTALNKFSEALSKKDVAAAMAAVDSVSGPVFIGACPSEISTTYDGLKTQLEKDFKCPCEMTCSMENVKVHNEGNVAWFTADAVMKGTCDGKEMTDKMLFTGVMLKRQAGWLIAQAQMTKPCKCQAPPEGGCGPNKEACCSGDKDPKAPCCDKDKAGNCAKDKK
jgi:ketosteroid isomerase-like protein